MVEQGPLLPSAENNSQPIEQGKTERITMTHMYQCVYCTASMQSRGEFMKHAQETGHLLVNIVQFATIRNFNGPIIQES